jgi:hypothetical protein
MSTFQMNPGWEKELLGAADAEMRKVASRLEQSLDALRQAYEGRPIEHIKPAVASAWSRTNDGARITDPQLTEFAEAIRTGRGITISYVGIKK